MVLKVVYRKIASWFLGDFLVINCEAQPSIIMRFFNNAFKSFVLFCIVYSGALFRCNWYCY